jgi:hypothetical protein
MLDGAWRADASRQTSSGHPTPGAVSPRVPRDCARDGRSGEREDVLQDGTEVLIEAVSESQFANPRTPLVLSDLGVAGQNLVQRRQSGIAVRGDHVDGGCELVAVDIVRRAEKGDVGVVTPTRC